MAVVFKNLVNAHKKAYKLIHQIVKNKFKQTAQVGIANDLQAYSNYRKHSLIEQIKVFFIYNLSNHIFYKFSGINTHDFLGVNYYFEVRTHKQIKSNHKNDFSVKHEQRPLTDTGWVIYPRGIYDVLYDLSDYQRPIYITENGVATNDDQLRIRFIKEHLEEIYYAIQAGIDIRGYCYWSLLDNYEWAEGYRPKFGLVAVDAKTQNRQPKVSAEFYAKTAQENDLWWNY
jgi:beta-glucosidase